MDYKDFETGGQSVSKTIDKHWWKCDVKERGKNVSAVVDQIYQADKFQTSPIPVINAPLWFRFSNDEWSRTW